MGRFGRTQNNNNIGTYIIDILYIHNLLTRKPYIYIFMYNVPIGRYLYNRSKRKHFNRNIGIRRTYYIDERRGIYHTRYKEIGG